MASVLDRSVIHAGKVFIRAGEEHSRAYIIQSGRVQAFVSQGDDCDVVVGEYDGGGRIIGETCLLVDEPMAMSYKALTDIQVVTITRQDFQNKLQRIDKDIQKVIAYVVNKLNYQDIAVIDEAKGRGDIDPDAQAMVDSMIGKMSADKKFQYEQAMLPHLNGMMKALKALKENKNSAS